MRKKLWYLYNSIAPQTISVEPEPKFQAPAPPSKNFWLRLQRSKISWHPAPAPGSGSTALLTNAVTQSTFMEWKCPVLCCHLWEDLLHKYVMESNGCFDLIVESPLLVWFLYRSKLCLVFLILRLTLFHFSANEYVLVISSKTEKTKISTYATKTPLCLLDIRLDKYN